MKQPSIAALCLPLLLAACARIEPVQSENGRFGDSHRAASEVFSEPRLADLAQAACLGDEAGVERAVRAGADPNGRGMNGMTPLIWALSCESSQGVRAMLIAGADPNLSLQGGRHNGLTSITAAAHMADTSFLLLLLEHGGDPNSVELGTAGTALRSAFSLGAEGGGWANYYSLLRAGADINAEHGGETIADFAATLNHYGKVAELLDLGYNRDLNRLGFYAQTASLDLIDQEEVDWNQRVRLMLQQRGVRFPVSREQAGFPPLPSVDQ